MEQEPKKCALCSCIEEQGRPTCQFCGEATWLKVWIGPLIPAPSAEGEPVAPGAESEPDVAPKQKRGKKSS